jgi:2-oxoglutarate/2-oxoacid ferredoxin oxidoreductase subunit alpha
MKDIVLGMAGSGGDGIVSAGELLIQAVARDGYHAMMTKSFGPQIRGGESSCRVRISTERVLCPGGALDVAIALNWDDFLKFGAELAVGSRSVVLYDTNTGVLPGAVPLGDVVPAVVHPLALTELTRAAAGTEKAKNSFVLGLITGYLGLDRRSLLKAIQRKLGRKGEELLIANEKAFAAGVSYAETHPLGPDLTLERATPSTHGARLLTDGNDMTAAAAIFAGCQFFGGYPITPSTEVMQFMSREIWKYGGVVLQAEDEIAGVGAAVGASFAGKKAMTATSGPGFDLKGEIMGLASIAELPLVVLDVQRGGPSTGIPTKGEQSDLFAACFSAHGDVVRPVLAPTSVADSFEIGRASCRERV